MQTVNNYSDLSDIDKINLAIDFVARGLTIPVALEEFLLIQGLYYAIANPKDKWNDEAK